MITTTTDTDSDWTVMNDDRLIGYVHRTTDGQYEARSPHPGGHKGGLAPLVGTFPTQPDACSALLSDE